MLLQCSGKRVFSINLPNQVFVSGRKMIPSEIPSPHFLSHLFFVIFFFSFLVLYQPSIFLSLSFPSNSFYCYNIIVNTFFHYSWSLLKVTSESLGYSSGPSRQEMSSCSFQRQETRNLCLCL